MGHSLEFILNHPVLSVALFIFIYLIISYEIKNFTKKYKGINCNDLVTKINESQIALLDTREKTEYKKGHISQAILHDPSNTKKIDLIRLNQINRIFLKNQLKKAERSIHSSLMCIKLCEF